MGFIDTLWEWVAVIVGIGGLTALRGGGASEGGSGLSIAFGVKSSLLNRNGFDLGKTLLVTDAVPAKLPYEYGQTIVTYVVAPIPRAVWPEKPVVSPGPTIGKKIYNLGRTGVPPGMVAELAWNFGQTLAVVLTLVAGFALGGGCEMAMMCDMIYAADTAKFGQPEIKLGTLPGAGGTQRLPRAVGKAKAMDLCLTARMMDALEAEKSGLVARVIPADQLLEETLKAAQTIAGFSLPVVMMIKESVNRAFESSLNEGLLFERRIFHAAFALEDQKEGMAAFAEKRKPAFRNR